MLTDAADIIFRTAKRRCYTLSKKSADRSSDLSELLDDQDAWDALDTAEERRRFSEPKPKQEWIPSGVNPVLEEHPKWELLTDVLHEIEQEILQHESSSSAIFVSSLSLLCLSLSPHQISRVQMLY